MGILREMSGRHLSFLWELLLVSGLLDIEKI